MPELLAETHRRAVRYATGLAARRVAPEANAVARLESLGGALPEAGGDPLALLAALDEVASPATVASAGPRYFGFVTGGALPAAVAAQWLASVWDQNAAMGAMSPAAVKLESIAHGWLRELLGLPEDCAAASVTGAQMANFTALAAARHAVLARAGWDVESQGLFGAPPITVVVGEEAHSTVHKALAMLGLGRDRVIRVPAGAQGRMIADAIPPLAGPAIICAQAGNVNTGAFDPFEAIAERAHAAGAWMHVDGAFGLWAAASPRYEHLVRGCAAADSWATDGHKTLNVPYDCGYAFVRDRRHLLGAMTVGGAYIASSEEVEPLRLGPDASRRARGVETWMALRSLGRRGVADLVERLCALARRFAEGLGRGGVEIRNDVAFTQVLASFGSDERTRRVIAAVQEEGTCWCGGTVWKGRASMRISVSNWSTTEADVDRSVEAILRVA